MIVRSEGALMCENANQKVSRRKDGILRVRVTVRVTGVAQLNKEGWNIESDTKSNRSCTAKQGRIE